MFTFTEEFNIELPFSKIPSSQLAIKKETVQKYMALKSDDNHANLKYLNSFRYSFLAHVSAQGDVQLDIKKCCISVVGTTKDGAMILSRIGYDATTDNVVTFIDAFDRDKKTLTNLYKHNISVNCLSVSVNNDVTLLAFTTKDSETEVSPDGGPHIVKEFYESLVVETTGKEKERYYLKKSMKVSAFDDHDIQSIQFIGTQVKKDSFRTDVICYIYSHRFGMYKIFSREEQGAIKIKAHPNGKNIIDNLVWYQWVSSSSLQPKPLLYLIANETVKKKTGTDPTASGGKTYDTNQVSSLYCFSFSTGQADKNAIMEFKSEIKINIGMNDKLFILSMGEGDERNVVLCQQHFPTKTAVIPTQPNANNKRHTNHSRAHEAEGESLEEKEGDGLALRDQDDEDDDERYEPAIMVSVFLLKHNCVLSLQVPFAYDTEEEIENVSMFFDRLGTQLLIYIPGRHLQFINCGMHEPVLGLTFTEDPVLTTPLPKQTHAIPLLSSLNTIINIPSLFLKRNTNVGVQAGALAHSSKLLDVTNGIIYRYRLNRSTIINLFTKGDERISIQALSLAIIHMQDSELIDDIMHLLIHSYPSHCTVTLFKEFLLASSFQSFITHHGNHLVGKNCATCLPFTTMESIKENDALPDGYNCRYYQFKISSSTPQPTPSLQAPNQNSGASVQPMHVSAQQPFQQTFPTSPVPSHINSPNYRRREDDFRLNSPIKFPGLRAHSSPSKNLQYCSPTSSPRMAKTQPKKAGSTNAQLAAPKKEEKEISSWTRLTNWLKVSVNEQPEVAEVVSANEQQAVVDLAHDPNKSVIINLLAETMFEVLSKEIKLSIQQCEKYSEQYRMGQDEQANRVWRYISQFISATDEIHLVFHLLCNLHCSLEDLWFPFPVKFREQFAIFGFSCLEKSVFLQYVTSGAFDLTVDLVKQILKELSQENNEEDSERDIEFKYLLLSKLCEEDAVNLISSESVRLGKLSVTDYLTEYKLRNQFHPNYSTYCDMEKMASSSFLPLDLYLDSLNKQLDPDDLAFVTKWAVNAYSNYLRL